MPLKVHHKDFVLALTKVFPSVSKKDELSYKALEGSLRKTRAQINSATNQPAEPTDKDNVKPTPKKPFY